MTRRVPKAPARAAVAAALCVLAAGCERPDPGFVQGYVEGEFVYVASPLGGALESLAVQRGATVEAGDPLFVLDSAPEDAARDEAARRLAEARAELEDAKKGKRPTEIASLEAQLSQARAALRFSESEAIRQERLVPTRASTLQDLDRALSVRDADRQRVAQIEADLATANLGARVDQVVAAEAVVAALQAALAKAEWDLAQKRQAAPQSGLVFDTLFREGEWVAGGRPVVVLLPPRLVKVRAFVPERQIGAVGLGMDARVRLDGVGEALTGKVIFISPKAEFTPPVIFSRESRARLVFMVEIAFDPEVAVKLHPGQPVDVDLGL